MANISYLYGWLQQDSEITIEDSEDFVEIRYNNEVKATYRRPTEEVLKQGVETILAEVTKLKSLEGVAN